MPSASFQSLPLGLLNAVEQAVRWGRTNAAERGSLRNLRERLVSFSNAHLEVSMPSGVAAGWNGWAALAWVEYLGHGEPLEASTRLGSIPPRSSVSQATLEPHWDRVLIASPEGSLTVRGLWALAGLSFELQRVNACRDGQVAWPEPGLTQGFVRRPDDLRALVAAGAFLLSGSSRRWMGRERLHLAKRLTSLWISAENMVEGSGLRGKDLMRWAPYALGFARLPVEVQWAHSDRCLSVAGRLKLPLPLEKMDQDDSDRWLAGWAAMIQRAADNPSLAPSRAQVRRQVRLLRVGLESIRRLNLKFRVTEEANCNAVAFASLHTLHELCPDAVDLSELSNAYVTLGQPRSVEVGRALGRLHGQIQAQARLDRSPELEKGERDQRTRRWRRT